MKTNDFKNYEMVLSSFTKTNHKVFVRGEAIVFALKNNVDANMVEVVADFLSEEKLATDVIGFTIWGEELILKIGTNGTAEEDYVIVTKIPAL
jgi:hypothetical protein